ncbi:hypothetical protein FACS189475_09720 [Betaproteobacteria bacterium]|nr:hypothetical protein FACS189475_09720 [Betaproteobacteria bacterium]
MLDVRGSHLISLEDMHTENDDEFLDRHLTDGAEDEDPSRILEDQNLKKMLVQGIGLLPEREKLMMSLYYEQELNLREIGEVMGVTESRVSQLHTQAIARLRALVFGDPGNRRKARKNG